MSEDLISRQAALDALERISNYCEEIDNHFRATKFCPEGRFELKWEKETE